MVTLLLTSSGQQIAEQERESKQAFYAQVASVLGSTSLYQIPKEKRQIKRQ